MSPAGDNPPGPTQSMQNLTLGGDAVMHAHTVYGMPWRWAVACVAAGLIALVGVGAARSRFQAAAVRGLTRFVGRDAEIETLRRTLEQAGAGQGQIVALVGEPGVGKSRLVWEFTRSHRTQGWLVLESGSVSYGKATSYLPAIDLLKSYCGVESRDDTQRIREKLTGN